MVQGHLGASQLGLELASLWFPKARFLALCCIAASLLVLAKVRSYDTPVRLSSCYLICACALYALSKLLPSLSQNRCEQSGSDA